MFQLKKVDFVMNGYEHWGDPDLFTIKHYSKTGFFILLPHEHTDGNVYNHVAHIDVIVGLFYILLKKFHFKFRKMANISQLAAIMAALMMLLIL